MKYYLLEKNTKNKACFLENRNSFVFRKQYYNNELFDTNEIIEISLNFEIQNKYLPLKNIMLLYGFTDGFIADKSTMNLLKNKYTDCLSFIDTTVVDDNKYGKGDFYLLYFKNIISGLSEERSTINFRSDDIFIVENSAELPSIFKFDNYRMLTFCDDTFKTFVEENKIEGWIFREAFEK